MYCQIFMIKYKRGGIKMKNQSIIISNEEIADNIYQMEIASSEVVEKARAGQFVHVKCSADSSRLLRRPISICRINKEIKCFNIVYRIQGEGTKDLSKRIPGDTLDYLGPLGNPFSLDERNNTIMVVGGGIGIFPLLCLLEQSKAKNKIALLGYKREKDIILAEEFIKYSKVVIVTDDGSNKEGHKGFVTDILKEQIELNKPNIVYTCGPTVMMKKVGDIAYQQALPCQVSIEERMGCGIGVCKCCPVKIWNFDDNAWHYKQACKEGPIFWSDEVVFDDNQEKEFSEGKRQKIIR